MSEKSKGVRASGDIFPAPSAPEVTNKLEIPLGAAAAEVAAASLAADPVAPETPTLPCAETVRQDEDLTLENVTPFRDRAFTAIGLRPCLLRIDLRRANFVDTSGLATLVTIARVAKMVHVPLEIWPAPHLRRVLSLTGLTRYFSVQPPEPPAASENDASDE